MTFDVVIIIRCELDFVIGFTEATTVSPVIGRVPPVHHSGTDRVLNLFLFSSGAHLSMKQAESDLQSGLTVR